MRLRAGIAAGLAAAAVLGACGSSDQPRLLNLRASGPGPDEFGVLPSKPLEIPASIGALPAPTPGGRNLTDPTPNADAVAALGGRAGAGSPPAADGALLASATRYGTDPAIRPRLASADLAYRQANDGRLLERIFNVNVYYKAYAPLALNQYAELERWRRLGVRTNGAPPPPVIRR